MAIATPCIGLCSTTFGDLVCRGCKRYVHEIVGWNSFGDRERGIVVARLDLLRGEALRAHAAVSDGARLAEVAAMLRVAAMTPDVQAFEVLRRSAQRWTSLAQVGCRALAAPDAPVLIRDAIEAEFLRRSRAHFEHDFRVVLDS